MSVRSVDGKNVPAVGTWAIDPTHSTVSAVARHLMVSKVRGSFGTFSGTIVVAEDLKDSTVEVTIDAASIDTKVEDRDNHLRSPDFLDVENHPQLTFKSTSVEADGDDWKVMGDLTMRGVTHPVELDVEFLGVMNDPWGNAKAIFEAEAKINREQWGLTWNAPLEAGGVLVSKEFKIDIAAQAAMQA